MRLYPAIDIKDGKCVRLFKGRFDDVTVYGDSPAEMAKKWESLGAQFIHVVDLDGALAGESVSAQAIKSICESVNVSVQTGGGVRCLEDIEKRLSLGVKRVILGTVAVSDPEFVKKAIERFGAESIVVGISIIRTIFLRRRSIRKSRSSPEEAALVGAISAFTLKPCMDMDIGLEVLRTWWMSLSTLLKTSRM